MRESSHHVEMEYKKKGGSSNNQKLPDIKMSQSGHDGSFIQDMLWMYDIHSLTQKKVASQLGCVRRSVGARFDRMHQKGIRTVIYRPKLVRDDYRNVIDDIEAESVSLILTDPPYGVRYELGSTGNVYRHAGEDRMVGDSINGMSHILKGIGEHFNRILIEGCCAMVFGSWKTFPRVANYFRPLELKEVIIWDKDEGGQSGLGRNRWIAPRHEIIMVFVKGSPRPLNGPRLPNVVRYPNIRAKYNHKERCEVCGNLLSDSNGQILRCADTKYHKTQKPTGLLEHLIERFTYRGEMVADFFAGSHSTSIAAMRTGRRSIGVEIEDEFHEVGKLRVAEEEKKWQDRLWDGRRGVFIEDSV